LIRTMKKPRWRKPAGLFHIGLPSSESLRVRRRCPVEALLGL
jgi:hypothetical protein